MNRYQVTVRNEEDFAEKGTFIITFAKIIAFLFTFFIIAAIASFFAGRYGFTEYYMSEAYDEESKLRPRIDNLTKKTEELERSMRTKDEFIKSFKYMLGNNDSLPPEVQVEKISESVIYSSEEDDNYQQPIRKGFADTKLSNIYFLPPILGYSVTRGFNISEGHLGADIVAKEGEPILCIADGSVIFSSWTDEYGYVVGIQHSGNITSFYKHNSVILKEIGDFVKAGDVIAIIGNSGKLTSGPHLHFEIWQNGVALDPEHYISFEK